MWFKYGKRDQSINQSIKTSIFIAPLKRSSQRRSLRVCTLKQPCLKARIKVYPTDTIVFKFMWKIVAHRWRRWAETAWSTSRRQCTRHNHVAVVCRSESSASADWMDWHKSFHCRHRHRVGPLRSLSGANGQQGSTTVALWSFWSPLSGFRLSSREDVCCRTALWVGTFAVFVVVFVWVCRQVLLSPCLWPGLSSW